MEVVWKEVICSLKSLPTDCLSPSLSHGKLGGPAEPGIISVLCYSVVAQKEGVTHRKWRVKQ